MLPHLIQGCRGQESLLIQLEEVNQDTIQVNTDNSVKRSFMVESRGAKGFRAF